MTSVPLSPQDRFDAVVDAIVAETGWCGGCQRRDNFAKLRCPAHPDRSPSLGVYLNEPHCFAGCTPEAVVMAAGLSPNILRPAAPAVASHSTETRRRRRRQRSRRSRSRRRRG